MMTYKFTVFGPPVPKARPRTVRSRRGRVITFTPGKTARYELEVRRVAWFAGVRPIAGPVGLVLRIFFPDARRRDDDNVEKSIRDALQERKRKGVVMRHAVAYADDCQVKHVLKVVDIDRKNPRVEVELTALGAA